MSDPDPKAPDDTALIAQMAAAWLTATKPEFDQAGTDPSSLEVVADAKFRATGFLAMYRAAITPVPTDPPANVDVPAVMGNAVVGDTLTCTKGNWNGEPTSYAYQWMSDAAAVGTGADTYVIADTDAGHSITCVVTATNVIGSTAAPPSNAIAVPASGSTTSGSSTSGSTSGSTRTSGSTTVTSGGSSRP